MHRLPIFQDSRSFDERTNRMISDVRRQIDEDLLSFGFGRKNLLAPSLTKREDGAEEQQQQPGGRLLSHDFFQLHPTTSLQSPGIAAGRAGLSSPPPKKEDLLGSPECLDEDTARSLYFGGGGGSQAGGGGGGGGQLFCMSFDVKDFEAEDISVSVEDDTLIVQAKRRTERDGAVSTKEFNRKIKLPKDVNPEELSSTMTSDGILTIEAQVSAPPDYESSVTSPAATSAAEPGLSEDAGQNAGGCDAPSAAPSSSSSTASSVSQSQSTFIPLDTPVFSSDPSTGRRRMELVLEVGSPYKPDDISVKLEGRRLLIEAVHEEKWQGKTSKVSMQRDFDLTEDIDVTSVQALLKSTGRLTITASVQ